MFEGFRWLAADARPGDSLVFHYSGTLGPCGTRLLWVVGVGWGWGWGWGGGGNGVGGGVSGGEWEWGWGWGFNWVLGRAGRPPCLPLIRYAWVL